MDIRGFSSDQRIKLEKQFNGLAFVISCVTSPDKTQMRLMIMDTILKPKWRERLEEAYRAATGQRLVIETALSAPATTQTHHKQRHGAGRSNSSDTFWFWAWLGTVFGSRTDDGN